MPDMSASSGLDDLLATAGDSTGGASGISTMLQNKLLNTSSDMMPVRDEVLKKRQILDDAMQRLSASQRYDPSTLGLTQNQIESAYQQEVMSKGHNWAADMNMGLLKAREAERGGGIDSYKTQADAAKLGTGFDDTDMENSIKLMGVAAKGGGGASRYSFATGPDGRRAKQDKWTGDIEYADENGKFQSDYSPAGNNGATAPAEAPKFGLPLESVTPNIIKERLKTETESRKRHGLNKPIYDNLLGIMDAMEPNLEIFDTGAGGDVRGTALKYASQFLSDDPELQRKSEAYQTIDKLHNDFINEAGKFEQMPGNRGTNMQLTLQSKAKPGANVDTPVNRSILAEMRKKITDEKFSGDFDELYASLNRYGITDSRTKLLKDAIAKRYPTTTIDQKTGHTSFNKENFEKRMQAMPDAIANPNKYLNSDAPAKNDAPATGDKKRLVYNPATGRLE